jgi:hypothetical protein
VLELFSDRSAEAMESIREGSMPLAEMLNGLDEEIGGCTGACVVTGQG